MAKKLSDVSSDSSLSSPPDILVSATETATIKSVANGKKRKAATTVKATTKRAKQLFVQDTETEKVAVGAQESPRPKRLTAKEVRYEEEVIEEEVKMEENPDSETKVTVKKTTTRRKKKKTEDEAEAEDEHEKAMVKKRTTRKKKGEEAQPFEPRTTDTKLLIGAHVSTAGGVPNAIVNLILIGGNAFAMFMKNQRKWESPALSAEVAKLFIDGCQKHSINPRDCCLPHGSYLVNLAHPDPERKKQAYESFVDDLSRCHTLGIRYYNFHPGNANATTREEGIRLIAENINQAHKDPTTGEVVAVLETMASLGNTIGGTFADLAAIIKLVDDQSRVGVCLDTCHVFAAGYDLRTPEAYAKTMDKFDQEIGLEYLKAFHINDSKAPLFSHRDLHARIGTGYLGLRAFHNIVNDERLHGLPMVLETPINVVGEDGKKTEDKGIWAREIKMLEKLVGMDVESDEFKELEAKLQQEGKGERERIGDQVDRKKVKATKKKKKKKTGKKVVESEDEDDMDE